VTAPNHLAGGYCFTGIISSLLGINILGDYRLLIIIGIASLLPDIDHTKSIIGKIFFPIARFLNRHYGHRTITHSIFVLVGLSATISAFQAVYFPELPIATVFGLAYGSHILFDCMTIAGVPLLYPFKRNNFVLPGNPEMRLRTSNLRHESMVFSFFIISAVFMKPLMANGFWTTYNSLFGTFKHLVSEYHKSDDMLHITFAAQRGSEIDTIQGLLVGLEGSNLTLIDKKKRFHTFPEKGQIITEYIPKHTKMKYSFAVGDLIEISADSLMRFMSTHKCTKLDIQASTKFHLVDNNVDIKKSKLSLSYPNHIYIKEIPQETKAHYRKSPGITASYDQIGLIQDLYDKAYAEYQQELSAYNHLQSQVQTTTDYVQKEILMERFARAKQPTAPKSVEDKILDLRLRVKNYEQEDRARFQAELDKHKHTPLTFTGTYEKLLINGKDI